MCDTSNETNQKGRSSDRSHEGADRSEPTATSEPSAKKEESSAPTAQKSTYEDKDVLEDEVVYKALQKMPYYHGFLPREDLGELLHQEGDYLLRVSEVVTKKKEEGNAGVKRDIVLSFTHADRVGTESEHKDTKSDANASERKLRNVVIRRYDGQFGIKPDGAKFSTIEALLANHHVSNTSEADENRYLKNPISLQVWEVRHSAVKLGDILGEGAYGEVRKGELQRKGHQYNVAVKLMKGPVVLNKEKIKEMMKEARLMRRFKHRNVVRFYGVAVLEQPLYILLELVDGGALNEYLQKNKNVNVFELIGMCLGAGLGLQYLHNNNCIHRDIAARNCLYSSEKIVKLSDFGLSLQKKKYRLCTSKKLPIKWLAPETITTLFFTPKTDVYSYGVMCWEIFSEGDEPWEGCRNTEVKQNVPNGVHLTMPDSCPEKFRTFVHEKIFVVDPKQRAGMDEVVRCLEPILSELQEIAAASVIKTAAERSERVSRNPADNVRSTMLPSVPCPPAHASNSSSKSRSKVTRRKSNTAKATKNGKKSAHPGNHKKFDKQN